MQRQRQRAVLITIDYEGLSLRGDDELFRGRAVVINAPQEFAYGDRNSKVVQVDREISGEIVKFGRMPIQALREREFGQMESELLKASRKLAAHGPEVTLIPIHEYRGMEQKIDRLRAELGTAKDFNLQLAHQNMIVRNHALRWKATAAKIRRERDAALGSRVRRFFRRTLTRVKRVL